MSKLSGWRRLWIVLSVLSGVPVGLIAWDTWKTELAFVTADDRAQNLPRDAFIKAMNAKAREQNPNMANCANHTTRGQNVGGWDYEISCARPLPLVALIAFLFALLPGAVMALCGLTIRWVYRGFRAAGDSPVAGQE